MNPSEIREYYGDFSTSPDPLVWAKEFMGFAQKHQNITIDMVNSWFAGAMRAAKEYEDGTERNRQGKGGKTPQGGDNADSPGARGRTDRGGSGGSDGSVHSERPEGIVVAEGEVS